MQHVENLKTSCWQQSQTKLENHTIAPTTKKGDKGPILQQLQPKISDLTHTQIVIGE